jgi:chemotaxis signal transduction protein
MENQHLSQDAHYLIVMLSDQLFALPYDHIVQIIDSPRATKVPNMSSHVRGTINFHGEMIVLYDMRKTLGMTSLPEEVMHIVQTLAARKQDHINWLAKLKDEVYHDREISVQTDPHKCSFGKWFDAFRPESVTLADYMTRFDAPHKQIHHLAIQAQELIRKGRKQEAKDLIHDAEKKELNSLLALFDAAEEAIRRFTYEYAVVLERSGLKFAISVDSVKSFDQFEEVSLDVPPVLKRTVGEFLCGFGRRNVNGRAADILILDVEKIVLRDDPHALT